ncbi:hypothetical protein FXO38_16072 [Capsicum annuum]|nr:hypothetical protein FXO37_33508 [Capsicum annuum]KAF3652495.1 hypothetical protein FXO38_16072 [Capsicum annuum]
MRTYLCVYDLWEVVEVGREVNLLPNNPIMTQIKNHREEVSKNFKALSCIQSTLSEVIFARIIASENAKKAWDKLKEEFHGSDKIRQIKVINLKREFEILRMKDSEIIEEFSNKLMKQRRSLRQEEATETALQAKFKGKMQMQEEGKILETSTNSSRNNQGDSRSGVKKRENFPPCKYCRKTNHKEDDYCFKGKKLPLQCRYYNTLGHIERFCRVKKENNQQTQKTNISEVEEQEEFVFAAMAATRLNDENTRFLYSGSVKLADKIKLEIVGKGTVAIEAPKVILTTKHNDDEQYIWESQTRGLFTVTRDVNVEQLGRGTKITLFLKEDQLKYLEEQRIKDLVKKHSEFISYPIYLWAEKTTEKEISNDEDDEPKKNNEGSSKQALLKLTQDQGGSYLFEFDSFPDDTRLRCSFDLYHLTVTSVGTFLPHQLNLVGKSKSTSEKPNVPHDEQLTKTEMGRWIKLLQKLHRQLVIGGVLLEAEFWAVRKRWSRLKTRSQNSSTKNVVATFAEVSEDEEHAVFLKQDAMLESEARKKMNNIKLYVWRVFIIDNCAELMPEYLGFLKGVVDSDDLSLNISHEMLQQNEILKVIRKNLVNKCIEMFNEIEAR